MTLKFIGPSQKEGRHDSVSQGSGIWRPPVWGSDDSQTDFAWFRRNSRFKLVDWLLAFTGIHFFGWGCCNLQLKKKLLKLDHIHKEGWKFKKKLKMIPHWCTQGGPGIHRLSKVTNPFLRLKPCTHDFSKMLRTQLKNISQNGNLLQVGMKIKNI